MNCGRDEMTSGGAREHRIEQLVSNIEDMDLDPETFEFYGWIPPRCAPPAGPGLGVARILMMLTGARNVREVVLFPRDRQRVVP